MILLENISVIKSGGRTLYQVREVTTIGRCLSLQIIQVPLCIEDIRSN